MSIIPFDYSAFVFSSLFKLFKLLLSKMFSSFNKLFKLKLLLPRSASTISALSEVGFVVSWRWMDTLSSRSCSSSSSYSNYCYQKYFLLSINYLNWNYYYLGRPQQFWHYLELDSWYLGDGWIRFLLAATAVRRFLDGPQVRFEFPSYLLLNFWLNWLFLLLTFLPLLLNRLVLELILSFVFGILWQLRLRHFRRVI
jgi:hypothetical protein